MAEEPATAELPAPTVTPLHLVDKAIEKGISPDQLGKLIELAETWRKSRAAESWAVAMNRVQAEAPVVVKDADNQQTKSRYARLESVNRLLIPVYARHGFSLCFGEEDCPKDGWTRILCDVTHKDGHSRRYHKDWPPEGLGIKGQPMMTQTHATGSTISYARRYLTCLIFNVTIANEDQDGNSPPAGDITREQHDELRLLLDVLADLGHPAELSRFCKIYGADALAKIPALNFDKAKDALLKAIAKKRRERETSQVGAK